MKRIRIRRRALTVVAALWLFGAMSGAALAYQVPSTGQSTGTTAATADCSLHPRLRNIEAQACFRGPVEQPSIVEVEYRGLPPVPVSDGGFELEWWMVVAAAIAITTTAGLSVLFFPGHLGRHHWA